MGTQSEARRPMPTSCTDTMLQQLLLGHADTAIGTQLLIRGSRYTITSFREQLSATRLSEGESSSAGGRYTFDLNHPGDGLRLHNGGTCAGAIQSLPCINVVFEYEGSSYRVVSHYAPRIAARGPRGGYFQFDVNLVRASLIPPT